MYYTHLLSIIPPPSLSYPSNNLSIPHITTQNGTPPGTSNLVSINLSLTLNAQAQTPQQRRANAAFARSEEKKMGRPEKTTVKKEKKEKPPISPFWVCTSHTFIQYNVCMRVR